MKLRILAVSALALAISGCKISADADGVSAAPGQDLLDEAQQSVSDVLTTLASTSGDNRGQIFICLDQALSGNSTNGIGLLEGVDVTVTRLTNSLSLVLAPGVALENLDVALQPLTQGLQGTVETLPPLLQNLLVNKDVSETGSGECVSYSKAAGAPDSEVAVEFQENPVTGLLFNLLNTLTGQQSLQADLPNGQISGLTDVLGKLNLGETLQPVTGLLSGNALSGTTGAVTEGLSGVTGQLTGAASSGEGSPLTGGLTSVTGLLSGLAGGLDAEGNPINAGLLTGLLDTVTGLLTGLLGGASLPEA